MTFTRNRLAWARFLPIIALLFMLSAPGTTLAHARLESSSISPGAILAEVPSSIELVFTEDIDAAFSSASLNAADESPVGDVAVSVDAADPRIANFTIAGATSLPAGSYALLWRVVSAVDGHTTSGVLAFSAGTGASPEIASTSAANGGNWSGAIGRWLELLGWLAICGVGFLAMLAADPADLRRRIVDLALVPTLLGLVVTTLTLFGNATGNGFGSWPGLDDSISILTESTPGRALTVRFAMLVLIAAAPIAGRWSTPISSLAAACAVGSFAFIGHAAGLRGGTAVASDLVHLLSSALWSGGLLLLAASLWVHTKRPVPDHELIRLATRFSTLAMIVFGVLGLSGLLNAWFNVAGPKNLTGETYGLVLVLKTALVILVLTTAAVNRLMVIPSLRRADPVDRPSEERTLRLAVLVEFGLAIVVVLLAARLSSLPPADAPLTVDVASRNGPIAETGTSGDLMITLSGELANRAGDVLTVTVADANSGEPATDLARLIIDARAPDPQDPSGEPIQDRFDADPVPDRPGVFEFPRSRFGLEAEWSVDVIARRLGVTDETASFALDLTGTAPQPPRLVQEEWRLPRIPWSGYLALAAAAVTAAGSLWLIRRLKGLEPVTAGIMLTVAAIITIGFVLSAWRSGPIPVTDGALAAPSTIDDPGAIQRAEGNWLAQCASCHGVDGGGIGDEEANDSDEHAHPSVAGDLLGSQSQARTPGELYWIITNGLGGTTMPAFDLALTDNERSDLVAYLRWLQSQAP